MAGILGLDDATNGSHDDGLFRADVETKMSQSLEQPSRWIVRVCFPFEVVPPVLEIRDLLLHGGIELCLCVRGEHDVARCAETIHMTHYPSFLYTQGMAREQIPALRVEAPQQIHSLRFCQESLPCLCVAHGRQDITRRDLLPTAVSSVIR